MLSVRSLLSRLFRPRKTDQAVKEPTSQEAQPQEVPRKVAVKDPALLELPSDHMLYELHRLRKREAGPLSRPYLRLDAPEEVLSTEELPQEMERIRAAVTIAASKRLKNAVPKYNLAPRAGQEPPPPPVLDAQPVVFVAKNKLAAWLLVLPPVNGGRELDARGLDAALYGTHVCWGLNEDLLSQLPQMEDRYFHLYLIAVGQPPVHGQDGSIVELFARKVERTFETNEQGQVDYASLNLVQNVSEGDTICEIIQPTLGEEGRSVLDQVLPAKDGKAAPSPKGRNTEISEDGTLLKATCCGDVVYNGRVFEVRPLLEIDGNVDYSTGNIKYLGDVHIRGDVCSGFKVSARGSVTIDGVVEASSVEAGGDVVVVKGVQGNEQASIRSQGSIFVKYLENCSIFARENLQADCVINCDVYCDGTVEVRSGRGKIIGGSIRAGEEISANIIGSRSEQPTMLIIGGHPCEDYERRMLEEDLKALQAEADKVSLQPASPAKKRQLSSIALKIQVNKTKQQQLTTAAASKKEGGVIFNVAHAGTEIVINDVSRRLDMEFQMATARLAEGEICFF